MITSDIAHTRTHTYEVLKIILILWPKWLLMSGYTINIFVGYVRKLRLFCAFYLGVFLLTDFQWESAVYGTNSDMLVQVSQKFHEKSYLGFWERRTLASCSKINNFWKAVLDVLESQTVCSFESVCGSVFVHCVVRSWGLKPLTCQSLRHWLLGNHQAPPTEAGSPQEPGAGVWGVLRHRYSC